MLGKKPYVMCILFFLNADASVFFHEKSLVEIRPAQLNNETDFGFSLSYQRGHQNRLVVGSPHSDLDGQVYGCPIEDALKKNTECQRLTIDFERLASVKDDRDILNPNQHFCLGMSIISTPEYFMTCAPLWPARIETSATTSTKQFDSFGTCFVYYNESDVKRYRGLVEQHMENFTTHYLHLAGTMGLNIMYDHRNELILLANPTRFGEISYVKATAPTTNVKGLYSHNLVLKKKDQDNIKQIGYALTAGKFFSNIDEFVYAFNLQDANREEKVAFLQYKANDHSLNIINNGTILYVTAEEFVPRDVSNTLFGAALSGADLNLDGVMELLIGAPTYAEVEDVYETGALFILIGGNPNMITDKRRRAIYGDKNGARFGTTIACTDLDGDAIPEIFVSAPYADDGFGVLYILSGYELNKTLISSDVRSKYLEDFKMTQMIKSERFKSFGYSLQVVPERNNQGCDNLAVGAPKTANVAFLRCIPTINVTLSGDTLISNVKELDDNFTLQVCVNVSYHDKSTVNISTKLLVTTKVVSGIDIEIENPNFEVDLSERLDHRCDDVIVKPLYHESGKYVLKSQLTSDLEASLVETDFNSAWVSLSPYSVTSLTSEVHRSCFSDCAPRLNVSLLFGGRNSTQNYTLGSKPTDTLEVIVTNYGGTVSTTCVRVRINGTKVTSTDCEKEGANSTFYVCSLPAPLRRGATVTMQITLNTTRSFRSKENIYVETHTFEDCHSSNGTQEDYEFNLALNGDHVHLYTVDNNMTITDATLSSTNVKDIQDTHEYTIINNGSIIWDGIRAVVSIEKLNFFNNTSVSITQGTQCSEDSSGSKIKFTCIVNLMPRSDVKIIVATDILKMDIQKNLINDKLEFDSNLDLILDSSIQNITQR
ncbi:uncharacterized protein LOC113237631 [Hyposmocoma kahamanoa]|uniref:uncharacterized protein LOC113237631 n=1 Tax=Hyposmocoma kahamanoa TaxID=1477025 RepID=UPI000E6D6E1E|nr:uncharacterized protein LOC113237631 [Hyposmocoma kahamanoa]